MQAKTSLSVFVDILLMELSVEMLEITANNKIMYCPELKQCTIGGCESTVCDNVQTHKYTHVDIYVHTTSNSTLEVHSLVSSTLFFTVGN